MLVDGWVGAPCKVLEAYMGEAEWPAQPTRGRKAQPLRGLAQFGHGCLVWFVLLWCCSGHCTQS